MMTPDVPCNIRTCEGRIVNIPTDTMLLNIIKALTLFSIVFLGACAQLQTTSQDPSAANESIEAAQTAESDKPEALSDFNLEDDTLYDLLVGEFAARRNQLPIALVNYIQQARLTRDDNVIRQAIYIAQVANDKESVTELAKLWLETNPQNIAAHKLLALQASIDKEYETAVFHIERVMALGGQANVDGLALGSQNLAAEEQNQLRELYAELLEKYPSNHNLRYSLAIIEKNIGNLDAALALTETVIEGKPGLQQAYVLKSNILFEKKERARTFDFTEKAYWKFPRNHTLGRLYASLLIDQQRIEEAEEVFRALVELYPAAPSLKLSLALVTLENGKDDEAQQLMTELNQAGHHKDESNFYLARIADQKEDSITAIKHYLLVEPSLHFDSSIERAAFLLSENGELDRATQELENRRQKYPDLAEKLWSIQFKLANSFEADAEKGLETLNAALEELPNSEDLRYARAMVLDSTGDLAGMEYDLKYIIKLNPQNAVAMNALGYTLADKTDRYQEAFDFIALALQLKPESAAILDSMGWVLYKLDRDQEALIYLLKAYNKYPDGEIGAHLGEVLFVNEQKEEALKIWTDSLNNDSSNPILIDTLNKLAPELVPTANNDTSDLESPSDKPEKNQDNK